MNILKTFLVISGIFYAFAVYGQGTLPVDEIDVIKKFDARIGKVVLVPNSPILPDSDTIQRKVYEYEVSNSPLEITYLPESLRPLAMPRTKIKDSYRGYIKGAYGLPNSILGQLNYAYTDQNGLELGVRGYHNSVNNDKNIENQRYSYSDAGINIANEFNSGLRLHAALDYSLNNNNVYGYNHDNLSYTKEETQLRYHWFRAETGISNSKPNPSNLNYNIRFQYYRFANIVATRQNDYNLYLSGTKWFNDAHPLTMEIGTEFTTLKDTTTRILNNFFFKPSYTYHNSTYKLKLGASIFSSNDEFFFFPDAEFELYLSGNKVIGIVGADGGLSKNTYRTVATYNPFVKARLDTIRNTLDRNYYGGLKGQFNKITYRVTLSYQTLKSLAQYNPHKTIIDDDTENFNYGFYDVLYADGNRFSIQASATYNILESMNVMFTFSKSFYNFEGLNKPFGLPTFELNAQLEYFMLKDNLRLWAELYIQDGIQINYYKLFYPVDEFEAPKSKAQLDFNLGSEYFFSKHFGINLQLYNVFNNKYKRWYETPNIGFQGLIGLTARF